MDVGQLTALTSEALLLAMTLSAPVLAATFVVSLAGSALQSVTQLQDSTLTVVPKIAAGLVTLWLTGQWMSERLTHFATTLFATLAGIGQ